MHSLSPWNPAYYLPPHQGSESLLPVHLNSSIGTPDKAGQQSSVVAPFIICDRTLSRFPEGRECISDEQKTEQIVRGEDNHL